MQETISLRERIAALKDRREDYAASSPRVHSDHVINNLLQTATLGEALYRAQGKEGDLHDAQTSLAACRLYMGLLDRFPDYREGEWTAEGKYPELAGEDDPIGYVARSARQLAKSLNTPETE